MVFSEQKINGRCHEPPERQVGATLSAPWQGVGTRSLCRKVSMSPTKRGSGTSRMISAPAYGIFPLTSSLDFLFRLSVGDAHLRVSLCIQKLWPLLVLLKSLCTFSIPARKGAL